MIRKDRLGVRKIDIAKSFERVDRPPITQPPDYTDYPSGDVKVVPITVTPKLTSVIPQEGLMKRKLDIVAISKEFQGLGAKPLPPPPVIIKPTLRIDIAKTFEKVDDPPVKKPPDYIDYPSGEVKAKTYPLPVSKIVAKAHPVGGVPIVPYLTKIIPQEGLKKRLVDVKARAYDMENDRWLGGLVEPDEIKPPEIKPVKVKPVGVKPVKNVGILSAVDKFFIWLNKILGE